MDESRYREAEVTLWRDAGIVPIERRLRLPRNSTEVRVMEAGTGPAVLFLHGGPGASGAIFAHLVARLPDFRCIMVDRPGTGLSAAHPLHGPDDVVREAETLVVDILDALALSEAHLVGSSHGSFIALLSAAVHPTRVARTVHFGCPGFVEGMKLRSADRLVLAPGLGWLFARLPGSRKSIEATLRQLGHADALADGRLPASIVDVSVALMRHTDTMRNELAAMASMGTLRRGFDPRLTIAAVTLAAVTSPTYFLWGENDPYGNASIARATAAAMPDATVELRPGAGHLTWLDDLDYAASVVSRHLTATTRPAHA